MGKWTHVQGWAALVVGVYAALSPIWTTHPNGNKALWTMILLGVATAVLALFSLADLGRVVSDWVIALLGVLFVVSPLVMSFTVWDGYRGLAWTAWIVGTVALVAGAWDAQVSGTQQQTSGIVTGR